MSRLLAREIADLILDGNLDGASQLLDACRCPETNDEVAANLVRAGRADEIRSELLN